MLLYIWYNYVEKNKILHKSIFGGKLMVDNQEKDKIKSLFRFLKQYNNIKNPTISNRRKI